MFCCHDAPPRPSPPVPIGVRWVAAVEPYVVTATLQRPAAMSRSACEA